MKVGCPNCKIRFKDNHASKKDGKVLCPGCNEYVEIKKGNVFEPKDCGTYDKAAGKCPMTGDCKGCKYYAERI